jgi:hypothetical protein
MASFTGKLILKQIDFDSLYKEIIEDGMTSFQDAILETVETYQEDCDISYIFIYQNNEELEEKEKMENRLLTIENASIQKETYVNAFFCISGIKKILSGDISDNITIMSWKLCESRMINEPLIKLLKVDNNDEDEDDIIGEDTDSDEEDKEQDRLDQISNILDFLIFLCLDGSKITNRLNSVEKFLCCSLESIQIINERLDDDMAELDIVIRIVDFLSIILSIEQNREFFISCEGRENLNLCAKMHKKNIQLVDKISSLVQLL